MNQLLLAFMAFVGGVFLAMQGAFNAQLGVQLKNPLLASLVAFWASAGFALLLVLSSVRTFPTFNQLQSIPVYLWFVGGLFSLIGISLYYYTIPKLGVSTMISLGLCGQIIFSMIAGHLGWFELPQEPLNLKRLLGAGAMIVGILLINNK